MSVRLAKRTTQAAVSRISAPVRPYYDHSFGFRDRREFQLPDCEYVALASECAIVERVRYIDTPEQLANRTVNAPLLRYVDSMRTHGHRAAHIDPLDLMQRDEISALDPTRYGLNDPSATYDVNGIVWTQPVGKKQNVEKWKLDDIANHLRAVYVGRIAYEYMHSHSKTERLWFSHLLESEEVAATSSASPVQQKRIHTLLARSEVFDQFLQAKFPNLKRYGLEGGESMLPALDTLFAMASQCTSFVQHYIMVLMLKER
jgi:probable 2-oxoglutarate dehydrogenase E1 component DHKTD1